VRATLPRPFWLLLCVDHSAAALEQFLDRSPLFDEIALMSFSHGAEGAGLVSIDRWRRILPERGDRAYFVGVDERRYPRGLATLTGFTTIWLSSDFRFMCRRHCAGPIRATGLAARPGAWRRIGEGAHQQYAPASQ
jgi:hypothetical protein